MAYRRSTRRRASSSSRGRRSYTTRGVRRRASPGRRSTRSRGGSSSARTVRIVVEHVQPQTAAPAALRGVKGFTHHLGVNMPGNPKGDKPRF